MKKHLYIYFIVAALVFFSIHETNAQCSICTKTASQLGEKPAKALNGGILYLMLTPLSVAAFIGIRWWKREKEFLKNKQN